MKWWNGKRILVLTGAIFVLACAATAGMAAWPKVQYGAENASLPAWVTQWHSAFFRATGLDYSFLPVYRDGHGTDIPGEMGFCPSNEELEAYLDREMAASGGTMKWRSAYEYDAAASLENGVLTYEVDPVTGNRKRIRMPFVVFSKEGVFEPEDVRALNRPVVWLQGQIHGNESTGSDSMQVMVRRLARGDLKHILDKVVVLMVPRANPEGAWRWTRANNAALYTQGMSQADPNRDGIWFESIAQRAVHKVMNAYKPHVVLDQHEQGEFSALTERVYNATPGSHDVKGVSDTYTMNTISMLYAPHPANSPTITTLGYEFESEWRKLLDERKIRWAVYHAEGGTAYVDGLLTSGDRMVPGARNLHTWRLEADGDPRMVDPSYGLKGAVSVLSESSSPKVRVLQGNRTYGHATIAESLLLTAYNNADRVYETVERGRREIAALGESVGPSNTLTLSYLYAPNYDDPSTISESVTEYYLVRTATGIEEMQQEVKVGRMGRGTDGYVPSSTIQRPYAYIIMSDQQDALIDRLVTTGVRLHRLTEEATLSVTAFEVTGKHIPNDGRDNPVASTSLLSSKTHEPWPHIITTRSYERTRAFPKGTLVMYMSQPVAGYGALALDPQSCWNFANIWYLRTTVNGLDPKGFLPVGSHGTDFPVYRLMNASDLPTEELPDFGAYITSFNQEKAALTEPDVQEAIYDALKSALPGGDTAQKPLYVELPADAARALTYTFDTEAMKRLYRLMGGDPRDMAAARWFFARNDAGDVELEEVVPQASGLLVDMATFGFTSGTSRRPEIPTTGDVAYVRMVALDAPVEPEPASPEGFGSYFNNAGAALLVIVVFLALRRRRR